MAWSNSNKGSGWSRLTKGIHCAAASAWAQLGYWNDCSAVYSLYDAAGKDRMAETLPSQAAMPSTSRLLSSIAPIENLLKRRTPVVYFPKHLKEVRAARLTEGTVGFRVNVDSRISRKP
jgi:hypothetical protein